MVVVWPPQQELGAQVSLLVPPVWLEVSPVWLEVSPVSRRQVLASLVWQRRVLVASLQACLVLRQALFLVSPEGWVPRQMVSFPLWPVLLEQA